jgi:hypothetical protein
MEPEIEDASAAVRKLAVDVEGQSTEHWHFLKKKEPSIVKPTV